MKKNTIILSLFFIAWALATGLFFAPQAQAKKVIDMTGKEVHVPDKIDKVFSGSPAVTYMVYAIDPGLLSGLNFRLSREEEKYLNKKLLELPVLGGFYGQGNIANVEMILAAEPDLIIMWSDKGNALSKNTEEMVMRKLPFPMVSVNFEKIKDYGDAFLFLGNLLKREQRARKLKNYADKTFRNVEETLLKIPEEQRPAVYYAEGADGLNTDCNGSWHAELIKIAGAKNVYHCEPRNNYGMERINIEQVINYDPDVIIVRERSFFNNIFHEPEWRNIKAVKTGRVYLIPRLPFNWFDRPPTFMRLMGIQWLMHILYPEEYDIDIVKRAKEFYRLFLGVDKNDKEIKEVINP